MWCEIPYADPVQLFQPFAHRAGAVLLHSAKKLKDLGRYSYFVVDPFCTLRIVPQDNIDALAELLNHLQRYHIETHPHLPPFQGGAVGMFSYELLQQLENVPRACQDDQQFPLALMGFYDLVVSFDHQQQRAWCLSSGLPETDPTLQQARASMRQQWLLSQLEQEKKPIDYGAGVVQENAIVSNFSPDDYLPTIQKTIDYITAGDIFETNIAQRFSLQKPQTLTAWHLFTRSCQNNAATFASYLNFNDVQLASASPERFLRCHDGQVECRPIKGTRPRSVDAKQDQQLADELCASEKDRAENIMIVDLMRNDISRVCEDHSVQVTQLCGLESYATVHHLVSVVKGKLLPGKNIVDLLRVTFPGGSITGAPKIRAMEIIAELEPHVRGPYCGTILCCGFDGFLDSSITIRTFALRNNIISFHAGGAIVSDSDPAQEYQESLDKAVALKQVLTHTIFEQSEEGIPAERLT